MRINLEREVKIDKQNLHVPDCKSYVKKNQKEKQQSEATMWSNSMHINFEIAK